MTRKIVSLLKETVQEAYVYIHMCICMQMQTFITETVTSYTYHLFQWYQYTDYWCQDETLKCG